MGGSLSHAADAMRRIQRRMNRRVQESKDRRRARRHSGPVDDWGEPDRVSFPCALLCSSCGYFVRPKSDVRPELCPSCSDENWFDLRSDELVHNLRDQEMLVVRKSSNVRLMKVGGALLLTIGLFVFFPLPVWQVALLVCLGLVLGYGIRRRLGRRPQASRWHGPSLPSGPPSRLEVGSIQSEDSLISPITQQKCVGWRVGVLSSSGDEDGPFEIDEMRFCDVRLGENVVPGESVFFDRDPELIGQLPVHDMDDPESVRLRRFLRARGISPSEGDFVFYESVVHNHEQVNWKTRGVVHIVQ